MLRQFDLYTFILLMPVLLISLTVHEFSHGFMATVLGDDTPRIYRRLSLNPIRHIDIFGFIMLVLVGFGWAKPVPVNVRNFKDPKKDMAFCAFAGPAANILLAFLSLLIYNIVLKVFGMSIVNQAFFVHLRNFISLMLQYNCMLALFNLLPIPPLDGSKLLYSVLPGRAYFFVMQYERYGMFILMILLLTNVLNPILSQGIVRLTMLLDNAVGFIVR